MLHSNQFYPYEYLDPVFLSALVFLDKAKFLIFIHVKTKSIEKITCQVDFKVYELYFGKTGKQTDVWA